MTYSPYRRASALLTAVLVLGACSDMDPAGITGDTPFPLSSATLNDTDAALQGYLASLGYTGRVASMLETRLGRRIDGTMATPRPASAKARSACTDRLSTRALGVTPASRQAASKMLRVAKLAFSRSSGWRTSWRISTAPLRSIARDRAQTAATWNRGNT